MRADRRRLFAVAAVLVAAWTAAVALLAHRQARNAPVTREVLLAAPSVAPVPQPPAPPVTAPEANDAHDPGAAGPQPARDPVVRALAARFLSAYAAWEVGRAPAAAMRATTTRALYGSLVAHAPRRLRDGFPAPARIGALAAYRAGAAFTVIGALRRGSADDVVELTLARAAGRLRVAAFAP